MSVLEITGNHGNTLWEKADGEKIFSSFSPDQMLKKFSGTEFSPKSSQSFVGHPINIANEQIATGQVRRFSSIGAMLESLNG